MREATMSTRRRTRPICFGLLCVALGLQAITPDVRDLASPMLLKLTSAAAGKAAATSALQFDTFTDTEPAPLGGNSSPTRADDQSKQPDEVCLPGAGQVGMMMHRRGAGTERAFLSSRPSVKAPLHSDRRKSTLPLFVALKSSKKISLLGRMIC
jgi:hypothetical protein